MKTNPIFLYFFLLSGLILSCSKAEDVPAKEETLSGKYRVVSVKSAVAVDLNNDGIKSRNILQEVPPTYLMEKGDIVERMVPLQDAVAILTYDQMKNEGSMFFPYPFQAVHRVDDGYQANLGTYVTQFPSLSFRVDGSDELEVTKVSDDYQLADLAVAKSIKKAGEGMVTVTVAANLYDFTDAAWVKCDVEVECHKFSDLSFGWIRIDKKDFR